MIYAQDEPVVFPVADLYDSGMMGAYLSAVKDLYERGLKELQEFTAKYGDFTSPFAKDVQFWNEHTMDPIIRAINEMRANGIDPARSPEARALLLNLRMNVPYATLALMKQSAEVAKEYLKNRGALAAAGKYNSDYERYLLERLGLPEFEKFSTAQNGMWTRTTPSVYQDLNAATSEWFDDLKARDLGLDPTGRYRMTGVTEQDLMNSLTPHLSGFVGGDLGGYHYNNAKKELISEGNPNPTTAQILDRLSKNIVTASHERVYTNYDADDYSKMAAEFQNAVKLENIKTANNIREYEQKKQIDAVYALPTYSDGGGGSSSSSSGGGGGGNPEPYGPIDALGLQSNLQYGENANKYELLQKSKVDRLYLKQKTAYSKLTSTDKNIAVKYGKQYRILMDPKSTKQQKENALKWLKTADAKKDPNFVNWKNAFHEKQDAERGLNYGRYSSTLYRMTDAEKSDGYPENLYKTSNEIYKANNVVDNLSSNQKASLDKLLHYTSVGKAEGATPGSVAGVMGKTRRLAAIPIAHMTGTLLYKYNHLPRVVDRILKDKKFFVTNFDKASRQYASGVLLNGNPIYTIQDRATFVDKGVLRELCKYPIEELKKFGIVAVDKSGHEISEYGDKDAAGLPIKLGGYKIPIITELSGKDERIIEANALRGTGTKDYQSTLNDEQFDTWVQQ